MRDARLRVISYIIMAYMLVAFGWWSILLYTKNRDAYRAKVELLRLVSAARQSAADPESFEALPEYRELRDSYRSQELMIMGEAVVIAVSLLFGLWFINRSYNKVLRSAVQQRNFLLSITHELKSPLAGIKLVLQTFLRRAIPFEQARTFAASGLTETERLTNLVNDLLLSARLETAYQPDFQPLNLSALIEDIIDQLRDKYPQANFQFRDDGEVPPIEADRAGITSIAYNLLENAVKYGSDRPEIVVTLTRFDNTARWIVADNGIGINDRDKREIFKKFYRAGSEETRTAKGTGLGLYIVRETLAAHKGNIMVRDNRPRGTIFEVTLPIDEEEDAESGEA